MALRDELSAEEWRTLLMGASKLGGAVMGADLSGPVGLLKEMQGLADAFRALPASNPTGLLGELAPEIGAMAEPDQLSEAEKQAQLDDSRLEAEAYKGKTAGEIVTHTIGEINIALAKVPAADAAAYKQWVYGVAAKVAASAKDGGFLGIGAQAVTDAEASILQQIAAELGVSA